MLVIFKGTFNSKYMEPKTSNKQLGIGISFLVIAIVVGITYFSGKNSDNQVASNTQSITPVVSDNSKTPATQDQVAASKTSVDDEGNNDSTQSENSENSPAKSPVVPVQKTNPVSSVVADTTKNTSSKYAYKNGTYTATGSYDSPGGYDQLGVTLTIQNDVITKSSLNMMPGDGRSARYEQMFSDNYLPLVIGKNLSGLNLGKVSRSSLTPQGFNDALNQIRSQAKA